MVQWHDEDGWGVISSPDVTGDIWAHFSDIEADGYRRLVAGQRVQLTYESPGQDGYPHRARAVRAAS